jgi:hypothetical protein
MTMPDIATTSFCRPCAELAASASERETGRPHRARSAFRQPAGVRECSHCVIKIERAFEAVEIGVAA